jgi:hypothetical protein
LIIDIVQPPEGIIEHAVFDEHVRAGADNARAMPLTGKFKLSINQGITDIENSAACCKLHH